MRLAIALCLVVLSFAALGAETVSLQGQWQMTIPSRPAYAGLALIDAERRATLDDGHGHGFRGYVAHCDGATAEIISTNRIVVVHTHCMIQSSDLLHCEHRYGDGRVSNQFILTRVGPGPATLMSVLP